MAVWLGNTPLFFLLALWHRISATLEHAGRSTSLCHRRHHSIKSLMPENIVEIVMLVTIREGHHHSQLWTSVLIQASNRSAICSTRTSGKDNIQRGPS